MGRELQGSERLGRERQAWHGMALTGDLWRGQDWQAALGADRLGFIGMAWIGRLG